MKDKIIIVGGGSAGWMTYYIAKTYPDKDITLIKSDNVPIIGVGESTIYKSNILLKFKYR